MSSRAIDQVVLEKVPKPRTGRYHTRDGAALLPWQIACTTVFQHTLKVLINFFKPSVIPGIDGCMGI